MALRTYIDIFFGKVTPDNAEAVLEDLAKGWYGIAALFLLGHGSLVVFGGGPFAELIGATLILVFGGIFLARRKSRTIAIALLGYALVSLGISVAAKMGVMKGQSFPFLWVVAVAAAWRGCRAAWLYHGRQNQRIVWPHVAGIWGITIPSSIIVMCTMLLVLESHAPGLQQESIDSVATVLSNGTFIAMMAWMTRRWPFVESRAAVLEKVLSSS